MNTDPIAENSATNTAYQSLSFSTSPWLVLVSVLACAMCFALSWLAIRRSGYSRGIIGLELLRCGAVLLGAILLNQPEWIQDFRSTQKPTFAILVDRSPSMQTQDVLVDKKATSRQTATDAISKPESWSELSKLANVVISDFPPQGVVDGTDLSSPLGSVLDNASNVMGVLVVSDGDWNSGAPPVSVTSRYRTLGTPIFAMPVGSPTRLPDLELLSIDTPTFGIVKKGVRIPFTIESSLPRDVVSTIVINTSDGERLTKEVRVRAMSRTSDAVVWTPKTEGDFSIQVEIPEHSEETITSNNTASSPISIRQEKLKVLVIDSLPRWEYRYLRNALSRDPGVEVSCLLLHPDLDRVGGGNKDYIKEFPATLEELSKYDVVFLGDVGTDKGQLTQEQCQMIRGLVEFQASGLVFMPGSQGNQHSLFQTPLEPLIPVVLDPTNPDGIGTRNAMRMELTEAGRRSLLTKLADTAEDNVDVWMNLPGFQWHTAVARAKAGVEVLAVHETAIGEQGRMALLATKTFGSGKVLFMGTDGVWRWRKGVEDKYHYRFWSQVVRWMAYQRNMAKGESMRFYFSPDTPSIGQTLTLRANVMQASGEPLAQGDLTARIESPSGKSQSIKLASGGSESWGSFEGRYETTEPGTHKVTLLCKQTAESLETSFFVQGVTRERIGQAARPKVLEELARLTGGKTLSLQEPDQWMDAIRMAPQPPSTIRRIPLWSHPWLVALMVVLLTAFWIGRKAIGLI
ncbi:MAG: hypothetical protein NTV29_16745 [Planctomycetota bacterium]|nr:hypothetical protein [Planctomycetota bacterium]